MAQSPAKYRAFQPGAAVPTPSVYVSALSPETSLTGCDWNTHPNLPDPKLGTNPPSHPSAAPPRRRAASSRPQGGEEAAPPTRWRPPLDAARHCRKRRGPARARWRRRPWGGRGRPPSGCGSGRGALRCCGRPAASTRSSAASCWGWPPPPSSSTGNPASGGSPWGRGWLRGGRRGKNYNKQTTKRCDLRAVTPFFCLLGRYLHVLMVFWSFVAGVVTFYCSLGPDSLLPNILCTIKYKPKVSAVLHGLP